MHSNVQRTWFVFRLHVQVTHARTQGVVFQIMKSMITVVSAPQAIQTLIARQVSKTAHHSIEFNPIDSSFHYIFIKHLISGRSIYEK